MNWRQLEAMTDDIVLGSNTETVRITFFKNGAVDPTRPQWTGRAVLHAGGSDSYSAGSGYRTRLSAGQAELVLDRSSYDGPTLTANDVVRAMDRDGQPRWEVASVSDRYSNLIVVSLTQA